MKEINPSFNISMDSKNLMGVVFQNIYSLKSVKYKKLNWVKIFPPKNKNVPLCIQKNSSSYNVIYMILLFRIAAIVSVHIIIHEVHSGLKFREIECKPNIFSLDFTKFQIKGIH